jgi:hypothetical protein
MLYSICFEVESEAQRRNRTRCLQGVDVVEKVGGTLTICNNRIAHDDFLNLSCAFDACFESILSTAPP